MEFAYSDIIGLRRPVHDGDVFSRRHPKMTQLNRAKIFAPFAALTGFDSSVRAKEIIRSPAHPRSGGGLRAQRKTERSVSEDAYRRTGAHEPHHREGEILRSLHGCQQRCLWQAGLYHTQTGSLWKIDPVAKAITVGETIIPFGDINTLNIIGRSV